MRSLARLSGCVLRALPLAALWLLAMFAVPVHAQAESGRPTDADIERAVEELKADPNLQAERITKQLRWKTVRPNDERPSMARWLRNLLALLAESGRVLMWVIGLLLAIALAVLLGRALKHAKHLPARAKTEMPTHVCDLDIRPESLPNDIGSAVLDAWARGERRAALALLYRGLLSRLVHVHGVPVRDSSTEGDCLALAARTLEPERHRYVAQVIALWQRATYGGREPNPDELQALCAGFDRALAPPMTRDSA